MESLVTIFSSVKPSFQPGDMEMPKDTRTLLALVVLGGRERHQCDSIVRGCT